MNHETRLPTDNRSLLVAYTQTRSETQSTEWILYAPQKSLGIIQPEEDKVLLDVNARLSSHLLPHRDANGFRKMILLLSHSGDFFCAPPPLSDF